MSDTNKLHANLVQRTCKHPDAVHVGLDGPKAHLIHMLMGITGEAGELMDAVKKHVIYNKPLDLANVIEELGDIEWYMQGLRVALDLDREDVLLYNIEKLKKRYPEAYSDSAAQIRADKV